MQTTNLNRRTSPRYQTRLSATIIAGNSEFSGGLIDISASGAGLKIAPSVAFLFEQATWTLKVEQLLTVPCIRVWKKADRVGLRFQIDEARRQRIETSLESYATKSKDLWLSEI
jgi:hypothetical protein